MKKRLLFCFCEILFLFLFVFDMKCSASCKKESEKENYVNQLILLTELDNGGLKYGGNENQKTDMEEIPNEVERLWDENYMEDITTYLDTTYGDAGLDSGKIWSEIMQGNLQKSFQEFYKLCFRKLSREFVAGKEIFVTILILAVLSGLFTVFMDMVENRQVAQMGFYFLYLLLCVMLGNVFRMIYGEARELLLSITDFVKVLLPAYAAALGMTNGVSTGAAYYEGILLVIWCVEEVLYRVALPLIQAYVLFTVVNGIWQEERLGNFLQALKKGIEVLLKLMLWVVGSIGILQSMITPVIDSLQWNTVKKITTMIPGVGNITEGLSEIFVGSAVLIRNGIGVFFTIMLLFICLLPLCKILAVACCIKAASVLGAVVNHSRMTACSERVADASFLLCRVLFTGMGLFLMCIAVSILAVNRNL